MLLNIHSYIYSYVTINTFLTTPVLGGSWYSLGDLTVGILTAYATGVQHKILEAADLSYFLT
jgi:hypothetical protein